MRVDVVGSVHLPVEPFRLLVVIVIVGADVFSSAFMAYFPKHPAQSVSSSTNNRRGRINECLRVASKKAGRNVAYGLGLTIRLRYVQQVRWHPHINAEIANGALDLGMAEHYSDSPQDCRSPCR